MLADKEALATIPVKDLEVARKFYSETLGLKPGKTEAPEVLSYASGDSEIIVYESQFAGTNKATAATWVLGGELDGVIKALKAKGVAFEHYDFPDMKREGDVHIAGNTRAAWFKDPDGNILSIVDG
jgi:catechol 2,3-dioxygenase-like lactoylglutathione lyase family enzyme